MGNISEVTDATVSETSTTGVSDDIVGTATGGPAMRFVPDLREPGRKAWTILGGLATLGGVLGLIQLVSGGMSPRTEQARMLDMIAEGELTASEAERLAVAFAEPGGDAVLSSGELRDITVEADSRQREALALMADPDTRIRGIRLWEDEAETAEDWRQLSELVAGADPDTARRAARIALRMGPGDFDNALALAEITMREGSEEQAWKVLSEHAEVARTPVERALAAEAKLHLLSESATGMGRADIDETVAAGERALAGLAPVLAEQPSSGLVGAGDVFSHPLRVVAGLQASLARQADARADYPAMEVALEGAMDAYGRLKPVLTDGARTRVRDDYAALFYRLYTAETGQGKYMEAAETLEGLEADLERRLASGEARATTLRSWLHNTRALRADALADAGESETARSVIREAYREALEDLRDDPSNSALQYSVERLHGTYLNLDFKTAAPDRHAFVTRSRDDFLPFVGRVPGDEIVGRLLNTTIHTGANGAFVSGDPEDTLGTIDRLREMEEALNDFELAEMDAEEVKKLRTFTLIMMAQTEERVGTPERARAYWKAALPLSQELEDTRLSRSYSGFAKAALARLER